MRRGTRVGQAYVAVTADGSGINEEIVDGVDEAGPGVERAGKEHGKKYGDKFGDNVDFDDIIDRMGEEMGRRLDRQADKMGNSFSQRFSRAMDRASEKIGRTLSDNLRDSLDDTLETFARMVDTMDSRLASVSGNGGVGSGSGAGAGNQTPDAKQRLYKDYDFATMFEAARVKMHRDSNDAIEKDDQALLKSQQALYDSVLKMEENKAAFISKFENARAKLREQSNDVVFKSDQQLYKDQQALFDRISKEAEKRDADMWSVRRATAKAHYKYLSDLERGSIDRQGNSIRAGAANDKNSISSLVGSIFGKGSRNNLLNLLGSTMGNVVGLTEKASGFAAKFATGMGDAADGASMVQKVLAGFKGIGGGAGGAGGGGAGMSVAGPQAILAIVAVIAALSAMASVAGALIAIITALASTIVSALAGALLIVGPLLTGVAVAGGLVVAAFMSMTDAQQALLSDAFVPLHEMMVGIGQLLITQMIPYFSTWSANIQQALLLLAPLAQTMGSVFGQAGAIMTQALSGPGFQKLAIALGTELPGIVLNLSHAFGSFLNGVSATFAALMPFVTQFTGYLADLALRFSNFANSAQGQNAIVDFTTRALASLQSLWNFVREFSGFVFDVLFNPDAQASGNSIFDAMADKFASFRDTVAQWAADGSLKKWFDDAIAFGSQLWSVIEALARLFMEFYNSGMLQAIGDALGDFAAFVDLSTQLLGPFIDAVGGMAQIAGAAVAPLASLSDAAGGLIDKLGGVQSMLKYIPVAGTYLDQLAAHNNSGSSSSSTPRTTGASGTGVNAAEHGMSPTPANPLANFLNGFSINSLTSSGNSALGQTSESSGGYVPDPAKAQYVNPYVAYANSLIKEGPTAIAKVKQALNKANRAFNKAMRDSYDEMITTLRSENKAAAGAIRQAATADNAAGVKQALSSVIESIRTQAANTATQIRSSAKSAAENLRNSADSTVEGARSALNSAAQSLASASSPEAAQQALLAVGNAQTALDAADKAADKMNAKATRLIEKAKKRAKKLRERTKAANAIMKAQEVLSTSNVTALVAGQKVANATLADFAEARAQVADKIEKANQKLTEAIQIRDDYKTSVSDSIKAFGALTTAQAKVIDGIEQSLTANDIVDNLQDRLDKIKAFQANLQQLLALGLSNDAYKQIVDMGVESGSAYAEALVQGGIGAVDQTNGLVGAIGGIADQLGLDASNRLYQAGVDAAQGLVDGLNSLSADLDSAATRLGNSIAAAVKKALGIKSPSRVLIGMMDYVGDGAVIGLDNQAGKVGKAATRFSDNIAVSPEVAAYAASRGESPVSGNNDDPRFRDLIVHTPTEDPEAVAMEVLNEVTGRL